MTEPGVLAYPILLAAMYGVILVGRGEEWGGYEWIRLATLAGALGLVVAMHVKLAFLGYVRDPLSLLSAVASISGAVVLVALYLWRRWQREQARPLRPLPAAERSGERGA